MDTTREDMTQAVLEGVAFGLRDSLEVARSLGINRENQDLRWWSKESTVEENHCKCMNLKVDVIENEEGPGYGRSNAGSSWMW